MKFGKQLALLVGITTVFVGPYLLLHGTNIVTHTYAFGAERVWAGLSPYVDPQGVSDRYKYSPFFAILYRPIALLYPRPEAFFWGVLNIFVFWLGISSWFRLETQNRWLLFGFLLCSMELDGSTRYQQINAMIAGLSLLGLNMFSRGKFLTSGLLLSFAGAVKILPFIFLAPLLILNRSRFLLGVVAGLFIAFLLPTSVLGWQTNLQFHREWLQVLQHDSVATGILDIVTVLKRYGVENPQPLVALPIAIVSLVSIFLIIVREGSRGLGLFYSIAFLALLLLSPRTESPTFVFAAPAYIFLWRELSRVPMPARAPLMGLWLLGIFLITLCMNDIWPRGIWDASSLKQANKTFGVFSLWLLSIGIVGLGLAGHCERSEAIPLQKGYS
jgi:hypothetical protein